MTYDAVVVGSGPNGLAAAITIARAGRSVLVLEAADKLGGGMRSENLTLPGFIHDVCSAVHPLGASSPLFRRMPLQRFGVEWVHSPAALAHPFDNAPAALLHRSIEDTVVQFAEPDAGRYRRLFAPLAENWDKLMWEVLQPIVHIPRHPLLLARFGLPSLLSADRLAARFEDRRLRAMITGSAGHAILPLDKWLTASFGIVLTGAAHGAGWPIVRGGSQCLADGLAAYLRSLGGELQTGRPVRSLEDLPPHRVALFDVSPESLLKICGGQLSGRYRRRLIGYRRGEAVFKLDYALSAPVPWKDPACATAATVHLGGEYDDLVASEHAVGQGELTEHPLVLVAQPSLFDSARAPAREHTLWAYCHLPRGSNADRTEAVERQIERFAPGFRDVVLARSSMNPDQIEAHNPNLVDGDITGGSNGGLQLFFRPGLTLWPYDTPAKGVYLCSASTPPGGGVHGMCGYWAARAALRSELR